MAPLAGMTAYVALLFLSTTTALPSPVHQQVARDVTINNTTTIVKWYQATGEATNGTCGLQVSNGTLQSGICNTLYTAALGIQQIDGLGCTFEMWSGVSDCSGNASSETVVPSGEGLTCVDTGVLDGGAHTHASGIYSCTT